MHQFLSRLYVKKSCPVNWIYIELPVPGLWKKSESKNSWSKLFQNPWRTWQFSWKNQQWTDGFMAGWLFDFLRTTVTYYRELVTVDSWGARVLWLCAVTGSLLPVTRHNHFSRDKINPLMGQNNNQDWILCEEVAFLASAKEDRNYEL
jgi:hypothetical protein